MISKFVFLQRVKDIWCFNLYQNVTRYHPKIQILDENYFEDIVIDKKLY